MNLVAAERLHDLSIEPVQLVDSNNKLHWATERSGVGGKIVYSGHNTHRPIYYQPSRRPLRYFKVYLFNFLRGSIHICSP